MNNFDQIINNLNPEICMYHNQPILSYDKNCKPLCPMCFLKLSGMIPVELIQQKLKQALKNSVSEVDGQRQVLCNLLDSLINLKNNLISELDKSIQIVLDQMKNIDFYKEQLKILLSSTKSQQQCLKDIEDKIINSKEKHTQFCDLILLKLKDFQQKFINIDHMQKLMNENQTIVQQNQGITFLKTDTLSVVEETQEVKLDQSKILTFFQYELINDQTIKQQNVCYTFAFNFKNSILLVGCEAEIIVYEFQNGKIIKELQRLYKHTDYVSCLYFMKKSNSFVSGSDDKTIIVWNLDKKKQWVAKQILNDHKKQVNCLLMNEIEDLLISGSSNQQVKFWKKQNDQWSCQQSIKLDDFVIAISLNQMENKLISCGGFSQKIYVIEMQGDKKWSLTQEIVTIERGFRLSFTIGNQFAFQPYCADFIEIYDYDNGKKQFMKLQQAQIQQQENCVLYCPCQYIQTLNILTVKNGKQFNIFKVNENGIYQLIQTIQFQHSFIQARMTDDGEYLITWDDQSKAIQLRRLPRLE